MKSNHALGLAHEEVLLEADAAGWYEEYPDRQKLEERLYLKMKSWGVRKLRPHPRDDCPVQVNGEVTTERWLLHYWNLRSVQPCCFVAASAANRMTGLLCWDSDSMPLDLDRKRLCAAQRILIQRLKTKSKKGQNHERNKTQAPH